MRRLLLVTAHPDDECMFFAPTIRSLVKSGVKVNLICLSNGDASGKGLIRAAELARSCKLLGISNFEVVNNLHLRDGMNHVWNENLIKNLVQERSKDINCIYTFDNYGVSGHPNHCSISRALQGFEGIPVYHLKSFPLWLKYLGPIGAFVLSFFFKDCCFHISVSEAIRSGRAAMYEHRSQLIWFRHLFVIFSIYMYLNVFSKNKRNN